jgi:hypothetical protein
MIPHLVRVTADIDALHEDRLVDRDVFEIDVDIEDDIRDLL